jgi:hypothetical protein
VDLDAALDLGEPLGAGPGDDLNPSSGEGGTQLGGDVLIGSWDEPWRILQQQDLAAEVGQDGGQLATVSAPPMTATRPGRAVRARTSV